MQKVYKKVPGLNVFQHHRKIWLEFQSFTKSLKNAKNLNGFELSRNFSHGSIETIGAKSFFKVSFYRFPLV